MLLLPPTRAIIFNGGKTIDDSPEISECLGSFVTGTNILQAQK